jgi:hypothetical protein
MAVGYKEALKKKVIKNHTKKQLDTAFLDRATIVADCFPYAWSHQSVVL